MKNTRKRDLRPTSSLVLSAIMNMLGNLEGLRFIDLFAGTGRVGLEAEKRGAEVIFVERNGLRVSEIKRRTKGTVVKSDAITFLRNFREKAWVIFADPPYSFDRYDKLIPLCLERIEEGGIFILEHDKRKSFSCNERREYGDTVLSIWKR